VKVRFNLHDDNVHLADYVKDPAEEDPLESWSGVEGLISMGAEDIFGSGTKQFLRDASSRQSHIQVELFRRYALNADSN
jgi:serine/threonine protein kinase HipA of HipAB toxin-antitoxin module